MATPTETQQEGHELVFTIKAVLEKRASADQLKKVLENSRMGLDQQIQDFQATTDGLPAELKEKVAGLLDTADETFGYIEAALQNVAQYLENGDENLLYNAGSVVHRGAEQLNFIFNELRNFVLASEGPTPYANLNLLLRAFDVYTPDKDARGDRLKEFIQTERFNCLDALDQLESSEQTPELQALKGVWEQHLRCMNRMFQSLERGDREAVGKELEEAKTSFSRLGERVPSATLSQRFNGPTKSQQVNLALSLARDVEAQVLHDAPLVEALQFLHQDALQTKTELEQVMAGEVDSVLVREEIDRAMSAVDQQLEALGEFAEFFDNRENLVLRSAMHKLEQSANALSVALDNMNELADRENKTVCIRCGHYNPKTRNNCEKCSAPLPNLNQESSSTFETGEGANVTGEPQEGPVMTGNLVRLYKAVDNVYEGKIEADAYLAELDWFQGVLDTHSEYEIEEPNWDELPEEERGQAEEAYKAMEEVQEAFAKGLEEMTEALELLRRYPETQEKADLEEGVKLMDSGARKIVAVREATSKQRK